MRPKCSCGRYPVVSTALGKCELCLYADEYGAERAAAQHARAEADRLRKQTARAKRTAGASGRG